MAAQAVAREVGYVDSDGEHIYFERTGVGDPVVLCHGLGGNHAIWWRQIEAFAAGRSVITWDQRGFGNSSLTQGDVSPAAARRDLGAILAHLGIESVDIVGQSMGGWTVLGYAIEHPQQVRSLILSTTLAGAERKHVDALVNAEPDRDRFNRREHPVLSREFCAEHPDLGVLYNQISSFGAKPSPVDVLRGMAQDSFADAALRSLPMPMLAVMADDDEHCPPYAMQSVVDAIPLGQMVVVTGGHSAYYERPDQWNATVLGFLDSL